ncbi:MAG: gamma-glutamyltransferase [Nitritalea sp.]
MRRRFSQSLFSRSSRGIFGMLLLVLLAQCGSDRPSFQEGKTAFGKEAMVVTAHPEATRVGLAILQEGGSAIDAMVAVHFALAVVYPSAGNIGGGGFMVYREPEGRYHTLDFREKAALDAFETMYLDDAGEVMEGKSLYGATAAGVPGSVDGMLRAHAKFGTLPLKQLLAPAVELAAEGFPITARQARNYNNLKERFIENNRFPEAVALVKESEWQEGDILKQPELAETLRRIQKAGREGFYGGETAALLLAEIEAGGARMRQEDLDAYAAQWRDPVISSYREYQVVGMGPSSSGGIALAQLLGMAEQVDFTEMGWQSAESVHWMTELMRRVYADRAAHLGDPDFWPVPQQALLDPAYLRSRVSRISAERATPSAEVKEMFWVYPESEETTHYSIIDAAGHAVSVTTTINSSYGSKTFVHGAGFLLNNEMDDFSIKPGFPNMYGLLGGAANAIAPGKRMLSAMTPTIIEREGKLFMVVGTPGGSTIITSVFQTILNVLAHGMSMSGAVAAPRFHHQWYPEDIQHEPGAFSDAVMEALRAKGHPLRERSAYGRVDAILVTPEGTLEGAGDPRGDDWAAGF